MYILQKKGKINKGREECHNTKKNWEEATEHLDLPEGKTIAMVQAFPFKAVVNERSCYS